MRKNVFYIHTNIVTEKGGGENARNKFSRSTRIVRQKLLEKNLREKVQTKVFYIHTNIVTKKGKKNERYNFSRNTRIVRAKNVGKKIVVKKSEKFFIFTRIS